MPNVEATLKEPVEKIKNGGSALVGLITDGLAGILKIPGELVGTGGEIIKQTGDNVATVLKEGVTEMGESAKRILSDPPRVLEQRGKEATR